MPQPALHIDRPHMLLDHLAGDRQSQAHPAVQLALKLIHVVKAVVDLVHVIGFNPHPLIRDAHPYVVRILPDLHRHLAALRTKLDGVVDQRPEGAL